MKKMMILTGVPRVAVHYRIPRQREVDRLTLSEARRSLAEGHFPEGSMGPKIQEAVRFLERGGIRAMIGHLNQALPALGGETGTHILPDAH